jgi:hypothetical protein
MKRLIGVVSVGLVATCATAWRCDGQTTDGHAIPDAPVAQIAAIAQKSLAFVGQAHGFFLSEASTDQRARTRENEFAFSGEPGGQSDIFRKLLYPATSRPATYHSLTDGSLMGRATYAASRVIVTRDGSGKGRLNTSYILRTLTAVAADTASKPYWRRSLTDPFSDFGSTVGNDAGMSLWREFGPGVEQLMKSRTPRFVSKVEASILRR